MIRLSSSRTAVIILLLDKPTLSRWGARGMGAGGWGRGADEVLPKRIKELASDQVMNKRKKEEKEECLFGDQWRSMML